MVGVSWFRSEGHFWIRMFQIKRLGSKARGNTSPVASCSPPESHRPLVMHTSMGPENIP